MLMHVYSIVNVPLPANAGVFLKTFYIKYHGQES